MYSSLMLFFISNAIETQLITSGAFEIFLNGNILFSVVFLVYAPPIPRLLTFLSIFNEDVQIWSKLQSERMPHEKELMQMLDMNFNFDADKASGFKA